MELISKEELINKINAYMITTDDVQCVKNLINNMPTVDRLEGEDEVMAKINYVRVVRCKDCMYASHLAGNLWTCPLRRDGVNENGYCHSGYER